MSEKRTYTVLDRRKILAELEAHAPINKDDVEGWCDFCPESIKQDQDECLCGAPVVWYGSPLWRSLFGDPRKAEASLRMIVPDDSAGQYLMHEAGVVGFANQSEYKKWERATNFFSQEELRDIVRFCGRKASGRGLISYVLNSTEKRRRDTRKVTPKKDIPSPGAGKRKPKKRVE